MQAHRVFPVVFLALGVPLAAAPQGAVETDVLIVERRQDLAGRDRLIREFGASRVSLRAENLDPRRLCRFLAAATGDAVNFIVVPRGADPGDLEPISLALDRIALVNLLGVIQQVSSLRFVYRDGMVLLTHQDEVKPVLYTEMYDLRSATRTLRNSIAPELGMRITGEEDLFPPAEIEPTTVTGFTAETVEDLLREHVTPDSWDVNGVALNQTRGVFMIRHTLAGHREVRATLARIGVLPAPRPARVQAPARRRGK